MKAHETPPIAIPAAGLISFATWLRQIGRSDTTGWRWVQSGWLTPLNIAGRPYLTAQDIEQFLARAAAGEFHRNASGAAARSAAARIAKRSAEGVPS